MCPECWEAADARPERRCVTCDEPLSDEWASACGRCLLHPPPFAALRAAALYRGPAREILLAFKFRGADYLARHLAARMALRLVPAEDPARVTCVPSTRRFARRADHAAELLAAAVAHRLRLPFEPRLLEKVRETERQSRLPLSRREANVRGAYRARGRCPGSVLLVDDVATSGATARECARRLRGAGASSITVWCFARASRRDVDLDTAATGAPEG